MNTTPAHVRRMYYLVFASLLALLIATVGLAFVNLGGFNPIAAIAIAILKASLVALFFMNLRASPPLSRLFAAVGLIWLMIMILLTLSDFLTRGWLV